MANHWVWTTAVSSALLRLSCYIFFRWIPGDLLPATIFSLAAVYAYAFFVALHRVRPYRVLSDQIQLITKDVDKTTAGNIDIDITPLADRSISTPTYTTDELTQPHPRLFADPPKEIDVQETLVVQEKPSHPLTTLLSGVPSPSSLRWSLVTFAVNMMLVLGMMDLTYRAARFYPVHDLAFARLGYVSDTSAKVFVREPDLDQLPIFMSYRYADAPMASASRPIFDSSWKHAGKIEELHATEDWTAVIQIDYLEPDTRYQWALSNNHSGHLVTAPRPGTFSSRGARTSPSSPATKAFTFLHSSCIIPHFPYNPLDHPLHIPGLRYLSKTLAALKPAFFLFLGDFIYVDVPRRHGNDIETYRRQYRQVYASPDWPTVSSVRSVGDLASYDSYALPWIHLWDDHEISNDWSHNTTAPFAAALDPYQHYHLAANPPLYPSRDLEKTYFTFIQGPVSFFVLDTRRYRSAPNTPTSTMLGPQQLADLTSWLQREEVSGVRWKIVVSSVPFTRNWRVNGQDTWGGYLAERRAVLDAMWAVNAPANLARRDGLGVVVLSGDRHEHATTAFPPPPGVAAGPDATVHEFSTSPLNMFYLPIRTYREDAAAAPARADPAREQDVCVHYEPEGNSKFGAVSVEDATGSGQSVLRYRLFVDGRETWSHVLVAPERRAGSAGRERWREGVWA